MKAYNHGRQYRNSTCSQGGSHCGTATQGFKQLCEVLDKLRRCVALNYTIVTKVTERYNQVAHSAQPWLS